MRVKKKLKRKKDGCRYIKSNRALFMEKGLTISLHCRSNGIAMKTISLGLRCSKSDGDYFPRNIRVLIINFELFTTAKRPECFTTFPVRR